MALRQFALALVALLGSAAVGDGEFGAGRLSGFCLHVFTVRASPVVARRHGARIWLNPQSGERSPQVDPDGPGEPRPRPVSLFGFGSQGSAAD